jgi:CRISPR-associated Csx2 family protein
MARILVSSVGVGNENREYRKTNYSIEGNTYENIKFLASAINEHYNIDKFFLIGTSKSMWEEVYSNFSNKKNSYDENTYNDLKEEIILSGENAETIDLSCVEEALGKGSKIYQIKYGINEAELIYNLEIFMKLSEILEDGDEIYIDITHSFRSLSLYMFVVLNYIQNVIDKKIEIKAVLYGMLESKDETKPVVNLEIIYKMIEWIKGANEFKNYGNSYTIADLVEKEGNTEYARKLRNFSDSLNLGYMGSLKEQINSLKNLDKIVLKHGLGTYVIPKIVNDFLEYFKNAKTESETQLNLSKWFYDNKKYSNSYLTLQEAMITYGCENQKYENNFDNREKTKKSMKAIYSEYKKNFSRNKYRKLSDSEVFSKIFCEITIIRNNIAHSGKNRRSYSEDIEQFLKDYNAVSKMMRKRIELRF